MMIQVNSLQDFREKSKSKQEFWLLIHKKNSPQSDCAKKNISEITKKEVQNADIFTVDVNDVRDIHPEYSVTSVPTLLKFEKSELKGVYKGCNDKNYYVSLFTNSFYTTSSGETETKQKSVVVYSTPSCSWCNRLKSYLRENNIKFRDIDVSKDQKAAEDMVKRSGQQGVPQSIIGGQVIVGFDKAKIDRLLGL